MNQTPPDATLLARLRKLASILSQFLWPGVFGVFLSFFENSPVWTFFIVLTAWLGVVMGLTGGPGLADYLLQRVPSHRQVSKGMATVFSLGTFWIPTMATAIFGLVLTVALREDLQPQSHVNDNLRNYLLLVLQAFSMYFIATGVSWSVVRREVKLVQQESETAEN